MAFTFWMESAKIHILFKPLEIRRFVGRQDHFWRVQEFPEENLWKTLPRI